MEGTDWYNRTGYTDYRNHYRGDDRPLDEDVYRGAYRFDTDSDHRNASTWDWKNQKGRRDRSDYNRDYNRNYNRDYNRDYNSGNRRAGELANRRDYERDWSGYYHNDRGYDHDNYNTDSRYRSQDRSYRTGNTSDWNRRDSDSYGNRDRGQQGHRSVRSRIDERDQSRSIFDGDYRPDSYGHGGGENYGNMAGSLSYGYDGMSNYDPDWNRSYNPLTGDRQSYHGHYTSRHPEPYKGKSGDRNRSGDDNRNRYY